MQCAVRILYTVVHCTGPTGLVHIHEPDTTRHTSGRTNYGWMGRTSKLEYLSPAKRDQPRERWTEACS